MIRYKLLFSVIFIFVTCVESTAQTTINGVVTATGSEEVLPFVNIGIKNKNIGTSSLSNGTFLILIPQQNENDTLTFSMVGYKELNLSIGKIISENQNTFQLEVKTNELSPITITAQKLVEQKFGIKKSSGLINITDGSTNQNDIFEIAQLIKLDTTVSKITSVNLYISESRIDSGIFRINFYGYDGKRPTERITEKSIIQTKKIQAGLLKFDLTKYNVYLKGSFVVAIEFIPTPKKSTQIYYEVKIGGSSKSFVRTNSQGEWNVPPHHYRLFITALVPDKKNKNQHGDSEEKESVPDNTIYSESVKDSFSIFINLPKNYTSKKNQFFPVIYLLDANVYFDIVADAMNENKSNSILVAIGYKDFILMDSLRNRDYLYPKASIRDSLPISGGAGHFLSFIEKELIPYINQNYRTDTSRLTLMGHSYGGYFTLFALNKAIQNNSNYFKSYVAASPSLDYSQQYIIKQFQSLSYVNTGTKDLYITFGGREDSEDGGTGKEGIDNFNSLTTLLSDSRFKSINLKNEVFPSFGHMETAVPTFIKSTQEIK